MLITYQDDPTFTTRPKLENIIHALVATMPTAGILKKIDQGDVSDALSMFKNLWAARSFPVNNPDLFRGLERIGSHMRHPEVVARKAEMGQWFSKANPRFSKSRAQQSATLWLLHFAREAVGIPEDLRTLRAANYKYETSRIGDLEKAETDERHRIMFKVKMKAAFVHTHFCDRGIWQIMGAEQA